MHHNTVKVFVTALVVMTFPLLVQAQTPLSLSDAVSTSLANNYGILIEQQSVEIARNNNNWGEAGRYPTILLNFNQGNNSRNIQNETAFLQGTTFSNNFTPGVQVSWMLFDGFRANVNKDRLAKLQEQSEGNANIVIQNTIQATILGYYRCVFEQERIEVLEKTLNVSRDKYSYVKLKKELGSAVTTEVLLEEGNYLTDSLNLINQQLVLRNAIRDLNLLMGLKEIYTSYQFTDSLAFDAVAYDFDDLLNKMVANNANLKTQYITQAIQKENIALARADLYPNLSMNFLYNYERNFQNLEEAEFILPNPDRPLQIDARTISTGLTFTLSYTLFNGGRIKRAIRNAHVNYDISNLQTEELKRSLARDLSNEYDLYNVRVQLSGIASRREETAEQNLLLSEDQFKSGTINSFDYREVQVQYLNSAIENLQATYNLIESNINLMRLTGGITEELP